MSATAQRDVPTSTGEVAVQRSEGSAMSKSSFPWHARPGLAGGIDKDGTRAAELLGLAAPSLRLLLRYLGPLAEDCRLTAKANGEHDSADHRETGDRDLHQEVIDARAVLEVERGIATDGQRDHREQRDGEQIGAAVGRTVHGWQTDSRSAQPRRATATTKPSGSAKYAASSPQGRGPRGLSGRAPQRSRTSMAAITSSQRR